MAIVRFFPGLKVEILVGGEPLPEYMCDDDIQTGSVATTYIEAQSGRPFKVKVTYSEPFSTANAVSMLIFCNGKQAARTFKHGKDLYSHLGHTYSSVPSKKVTNSLRQRFYFEELSTTESDSMMDTQLTRVVEDIGTITITFQLAGNVRKVPSKTSGPGRLTTPDSVPEKAMKGDKKSHAIGLGPIEPARRPTSFFQWRNIGSDPFARFHFKYRSRETLQALGILSRESTPEAEPDTLENELLLSEVLRGVKRKAKDVVKQEPDADPQSSRHGRLLKAEDGEDDGKDAVYGLQSRSYKKRRG